MKAVLERLSNGEPIQYIFGYVLFYDLKIAVSRDVLIPRPETEYLVHIMLRENRKRKPASLIDLCTGSGCIAVALASQLPNTAVTATDISENALEVAQRNAAQAGVSVQFIKDDLLNTSNSYPLYDCVVSNPPYVRNSEKEFMHRNVLDFEPHQALFVDDRDPLLFYKAIADFGKEYLAPEGTLWCEINENLGSETVALFERRGYSETRIYKDLNRKDRFLKAKMET